MRTVLYHANCLDGFTAAWVVHMKYRDTDTQYIAAQYGDPPPDVKGHDVVLVDFSYKRDVLLELRRQARSLLILDHHKTAQAELAGFKAGEVGEVHFDMERSGAGLAWDYYLPSKPRRFWLVDYVEDRDLWRFKLPDSKAVNAWIDSHPRKSFEDWDRLYVEGVDEARIKGAAVLTFMDRYVYEMGLQARNIDFLGHRVPCVNQPYILTSEVVGALAETSVFAVGWFQRRDGMYQYSLRSRGDFDVSEIAKIFGGGGHKNAAGFQLPHRVELDMRFWP